MANFGDIVSTRSDFFTLSPAQVKTMKLGVFFVDDDDSFELSVRDRMRIFSLKDLPAGEEEYTSIYTEGGSAYLILRLYSLQRYLVGWTIDTSAIGNVSLPTSLASYIDLTTILRILIRARKIYNNDTISIKSIDKLSIMGFSSFMLVKGKCEIDGNNRTVKILEVYSPENTPDLNITKLTKELVSTDPNEVATVSDIYTDGAEFLFLVSLTGEFPTLDIRIEGTYTVPSGQEMSYYSVSGTVQNEREVDSSDIPDNKVKDILKYWLGAGVPEITYHYTRVLNKLSSAPATVQQLLDQEIIPFFATQDITFLVPILPLSSAEWFGVIERLYNHVVESSSKILDFDGEGTPKGQMERYLILGFSPTFLSQNNYENIGRLDGKLVGEGGRRAFVITYNFDDVSVSPVGKLSFLGGDCTPTLVALATVCTYIINKDPALPLTEKQIYGVELYGNKYDIYVLKKFHRNGIAFLYADDPYGPVRMYRSITFAYRFFGEKYGDPRGANILLEDTELSIIVPEDLMDKTNRTYLRQFRGQKITASLMKKIKEKFTKEVLSTYLQVGLVAAIDLGSFNIRQDPLDRTKLIGEYSYTPVYPVNKIWIYHAFSV